MDDTDKVVTSADDVEDPSEREWVKERIAQFWRDAEDEAQDEDPYPCADNFRFAVKGDEASELEYEDRHRDGCCGQVDVDLGPSPAGKVYWYGFNYGH